jgi:hypothetical protein
MPSHKTTLLFAAAALVLITGSPLSFGQVDPENLMDALNRPFEFVDTEDIVERGIETGTTGETYYRDAVDRVNVDVSEWVLTDPETGAEKEVMITVFEGIRVFCSRCETLLLDTTRFRSVSMADSCYYFDDGSHGDLIANDGLPTLVEDYTDSFIGAKCYRQMEYLTSLRDRAKWADLAEAIEQGREPLVRLEPHRFYAEVRVVSNDEEDLLPDLARTRPMIRRQDLWEKHEDTLERIERDYINLYRRVPNPESEDPIYVDYWVFPNIYALQYPESLRSGERTRAPGMEKLSIPFGHGPNTPSAWRF